MLCNIHSLTIKEQIEQEQDTSHTEDCQYLLVFLLVISAAPSWLLAVLDNDTPGPGLASPRREDKPFSVATQENYLVWNHIPKY